MDGDIFANACSMFISSNLRYSPIAIIDFIRVHNVKAIMILFITSIHTQTPTADLRYRHRRSCDGKSWFIVSKKWK